MSDQTALDVVADAADGTAAALEAAAVAAAAAAAGAVEAGSWVAVGGIDTDFVSNLQYLEH
jgi:hypothetical protein